MRIRNTRKICVALSALAMGLVLSADVSAKLRSAKRSFGAKRPHAARVNVVRPAPGTQLTNRISLQPLAGGRTLMSVVSSVSGKPMIGKPSGRRFSGANAFYLIAANGKAKRIRSWGTLEKVHRTLDSKATTPPATKIYLDPLKNGGSMMSTRGANNGPVQYYYVGKTGALKQLTSWPQVQKAINF